MKPTIYLNFPGTCLEAMTYYANVLGGEVRDVFRNGDAPRPQDRMPGDDDLVMNLSLYVGGDLIMASDAPPEMYETPQGFSVSLAP